MTEVASAFVTLLPSARGFGSKLTGQVGPEVGQSGSALGGLLGKTMLVGFAAAGVVAGVAGTLYKIGSEFDNVNDTIRASTGKSGAALQGLEDVAKKVGQNVPVSFDQVGPVISDLNRRLGLTGKPLQILSEQFLDLGHITGTAIDTQAVTGALNIFGVKGVKSAQVMDQLFRVTQSTGIGFNDLTSSLGRNGAVLSQFGFSIDQSASLIGTLDKAGIDSNKTIGTLSHAMATFAKAGKDPQKALQDTIGQIQGFIKKGDQAGAINVAAKIFGTRGATQFVAAVKSGSVSMDQLTNATKGNHDSIVAATNDTADFAEHWQEFKNRTMVALAPVANKVFNAVGNAATRVGPVVTKALAQIGPEVQRLATRVAPLIASFQRNFIPAAQQLATMFQAKVLPALKQLGGYLVATLLPVFQGIVSFIGGSVLPILSSLAQFFVTKVLPAVIKIALSVAHSLKPVLDQLAKTFQTQLLPALKVAFAKFQQALPTLEKIALFVLKVVGAVLRLAAAILGKVLPPLIRLIGFILGTAIKVLATLIVWVIKIIGHLIDFGGALVDAVKFAVKFQVGIINAAGKVVSWFKALPGKILGFLKGLPGQMAKLGVAIASGLANGIRGAAHWVLDEVKKLVDLIPKKIRSLLHISSPSKVTEELGGFIGDGLARGIAGSADKVSKATGKLIDSIKGKLGDIRTTFQGLVDPIAQAFTGSLFDPTSASAFVSNLTANNGTLAALSSAFQKLLGWGLSPGFLAQLFQSGNTKLILSLAAGGKDQATNAANLFGQVSSAAQNLGAAVVSATDQGAALDKQTAKLTAKLDHLIKSGDKNAKMLADAFTGSATRAKHRARAA